MDMSTLVTLLATILAHAIAALAPGGSGIPALVEVLTRYLLVAAHGGGLTGGCDSASYVGGVLTSCHAAGNMAWVEIPPALQPVALAAARVLSWLLFPTGM